ncbi:MAG TPA: hypothetical protein DDW54_00715, partial [Clostridiales bacterium]|nr:hypothetical protein [Clostridiales bacterium]
MKIKFLGTGASEAIPAFFCGCPVCESARKNGGKEIRTRAGVVIDDRLMIDFGPDTLLHTLYTGLDLSKIKSVLFTHSHSDHFYAFDLLARSLYSGEGAPNDILKVYGSAAIKNGLIDSVWYNRERVFDRISFCEIAAEREFFAEGYKITPIGVIHIPTEPCFMFLIEKDGKAYLHVHDSDFPTERAFAFLKDKGVKLNAVTFDCTYGLIKTEYGGHMNLYQNIRAKDRLIKDGTADGNTKFYSSHICHMAG